MCLAVDEALKSLHKRQNTEKETLKEHKKKKKKPGENSGEKTTGGYVSGKHKAIQSSRANRKGKDKATSENEVLERGQKPTRRDSKQSTRRLHH